MPVEDELRVDITADDRRLQGAFDRLDRQIDGIDSRLDKASGRMSRALGGVGRAAGAVSLAVGGIGVAAVGAGLKVAAEMEQAEIAFTTLLGSAEQAESFIADLADFAARTPFEFAGVRDAAQKFLAMGFAAEDIEPILTSVGDAVAAMGGGQDEIAGVTRALTQMQAKGKVSAEEMLQLAERGIPAWEFLADKLGTDIPSAMDEVSKGAVQSATFIEAFLEGTASRFGGAMEAQSQSLTGMLSTLKDTIAMQLGQAAEPLVRSLKDALPEITATLDAVIGQALPPLVEALSSLLPVITSLAGPVGTLAGILGNAFQMVAPVLERVASLIGDLFTGLAESGLLEAILGGLVSVVEALLPAFEALMPALTSVFEALGNALATILPLLTPILEQLAGILGKALAQALEVVALLLNALAPIIVAVLTPLMPLISAILDLVEIALVPLMPLLEAVTPLLRLIAMPVQALASLVSGALSPSLEGLGGVFQAIMAPIQFWWNMVKQLVAWLAAAFSAPIEAIKRLFTGLGSFFLGLASKALEWGRNIVEGLANGIKNAAGKVVDGVKSVGSKIANGFKSFFGIGSPSKLFAGFGGFLMDGLGQGVEKAQSRVLGALDKVSGGLLSRVKDRLDQARGIAESDVSVRLNNGPGPTTPTGGPRLPPDDPRGGGGTTFVFNEGAIQVPVQEAGAGFDPEQTARALRNALGRVFREASAR